METFAKKHLLLLETLPIESKCEISTQSDDVGAESIFPLILNPSAKVTS